MYIIEKISKILVLELSVGNFIFRGKVKENRMKLEFC